MIDGLLFDFWRCLSGLISCKIVCVTETELDSEATMYYVIGAILYRTLGVILPAPMWVHLVISTLQLLRFQTIFHLLFLPMSFFFFIFFLHLSVLSLTSFHFSYIFFYLFASFLWLTTFLFLCSFFFCSPSLSNSNLQFSICLLSYSVSITTPPHTLCVYLVIRQMSWISQKSTFP